MRILVFLFSFDKSYVLFGSDSLCYSLVKKYPKKRLELRFKCSDTGESVRQSLDEVPWPDDGLETGSSDVLQDPWNELGDPRAHPW